MPHVTPPRTGWYAPVTTVNHQLGWLLRQLDHTPATRCTDVDKKSQLPC